MENKAQKGEVRFIRLGIVTIFAVYLLILVGGIVRSTGSGMGCPDWPKCFGSWVPPTEVNDLPDNYKDVYANQRAAKNERFSGYLDFMGFSETADQIRNDKTILIEADFNATKTWIEYLNRLLGAVIGILIFATFISSLYYRKFRRQVTIYAFLSFALVVFQGWIGSVVVSTNLLPWLITIHMLLAFLLLAILIMAVYKAVPKFRLYRGENLISLKIVLILCILTLIVQVALGTQVREAIDEIATAFNFSSRDLWIGELGFTFFFHRSFSLLILGLHSLLVFLVIKKAREDVLMRGGVLFYLLVILIGSLAVEIGSGVVMAYFAIPSFAQPIHLLLSSVIFGVLFLLFLTLDNEEKGTEAGFENFKHDALYH